MTAHELALELLGILAGDAGLAAWAEANAGGALTVQLGDDAQADQDLPCPCLLIPDWASERPAHGGQELARIQLEAWVRSAARDTAGRAVVYRGRLMSEELLEQAQNILQAARPAPGRVRFAEAMTLYALPPLYASQVTIEIETINPSRRTTK